MNKPATPPPPKEALEYLRAKGYKIGWDYRDVWKEEHVRAFTVAKAMTQDLLIDIRQAVDAALANGKTFRQFKAELEPTLGKRGWLGSMTAPDGSQVELGTPRRLKVIYDTNMRTARAAGQWERIERNKQAMPFLMYGLGPSLEHRLEHVGWDGLILPVDDPFWDTHTPPNGYGCKCRVRQITKRQADRRGGVSKRPKAQTTTWENKRTGKIERVPKGIDPGWDYNAGKARQSNTQQFGADKDAEFKKVVGTVAAPAPIPSRVVPSVMSTLKNISADDLEDVLRQLPGAEDRLKKVQAFTNAKGTKTLVIRQTEMGARNKASLAVRDQVLGYLDENQRQFGHYNYTTSKPARVGGFTSASFNHVVVKGNSNVSFRRADKAAIAAELRRAVDAATTRKTVNPKLLEKMPHLANEPDMWALAYGGSKEAELVATWVHELGHQVHYWAGAPSAPVGAKYLTRYSQTNKYEYHAEHFSAWLFNRDALAKFNPVAAKHFDDLIEKATKSTEKKR